METRWTPRHRSARPNRHTPRTHVQRLGRGGHSRPAHDTDVQHSVAVHSHSLRQARAAHSHASGETGRVIDAAARVAAMTCTSRDVTVLHTVTLQSDVRHDQSRSASAVMRPEAAPRHRQRRGSHTRSAQRAAPCDASPPAPTHLALIVASSQQEADGAGACCQRRRRWPRRCC
jgi:hypothetical protein